MSEFIRIPPNGVGPPHKEEPDVMGPDFWKSKTHLDAVIDELERANNMPIWPKGGQHVGMDQSWDLAHNRMRSKREINWAIREIRIVINEHFKEKD